MSCGCGGGGPPEWHPSSSFGNMQPEANLRRVLAKPCGAQPNRASAAAQATPEGTPWYIWLMVALAVYSAFKGRA